MRDKRKSPLLIFLLAISVVALAVSYFFLPDGVAKPDTGLISIPWLSCAAALVCLAVTAASMGLLNYNDFLYTSDTKLLYLPYLLAALSVPGSMELSVWHIAALLILWAVFYAVRYLNSEQLRMDYIFGAMLMAGAASAIVPCLMYAQIFIFIHCLYRRGQEPLRHLLASLAGTALPWVCAAALAFFFPESFSIEGYAAFFRDGMALSLPSLSCMSVREMVWAGFGLVLGIRSVIFVLSRGRERNKAQKNSFGLSVALSVIFFLTAAFCEGLGTPLFIMPAAVPLSFVVFDLFTNGGRVEVGAWTILLLLLAAVNRILEFFPDILLF